jgi:NAD+ synthase (glutamine-hydrolysing)
VSRNNVLRIGLAQINAVVGDISGNVAKIFDYYDEADENAVDIVAFPELSITGYPPEDLLLKREFVEDNLAALKELASRTRKKETIAIVGHVDRDESGNAFNSAAVVYHGRVYGKYHKILLPNYGVFDERRYFTPGTGAAVLRLDGINIGLNICEDIWHREGPSFTQAEMGAQLIITLNSSPYHVEKWKDRLCVLQERCKEIPRFFAYVNLVGGQDELVFDGHSLIISPEGEILARGASFKEDLVMIDISRTDLNFIKNPDSRAHCAIDYPRLEFTLGTAGKVEREEEKPLIGARKNDALPRVAEIYEALVLGTRDYVRKNGFKKVLLGLSGGIDSALTASIAVDALGKENVKAVMMPSQFTSKESLEDAAMIARNLGTDLYDIPITSTYSSYLDSLSDVFRDLRQDVTEENIQARIRGNLLMALSNKFGWLLLTTGNKSEMSVGYCTLYGDMSGGFAVIKDVVKTDVYAMCRYKNEVSGKEIIPRRVLEKAPSAELRPGQKDTDTLPSYEILDPILQAYVERDESPEEIIQRGFRKETVEWVIRNVDRNEYKRRQAPPGVKITQRAFGKDRRMPITNGYKH